MFFCHVDSEKQEILGHNEDALSETLNHWYLVSAHVIEPGCKQENFTSLSYAGFLPGYTMGYNQYGLVYTINTLSAATLRSGKTREYVNSLHRVFFQFLFSIISDTNVHFKYIYCTIFLQFTFNSLSLSLSLSLSFVRKWDNNIQPDTS